MSVLMQSWVVVIAVVAYLAILFGIASYGERKALRRKRLGQSPQRSPYVYALALGVYCTSWTFFGSVGLAATAGFDFLTIYLGAGLMIVAGYPLLRRIAMLANSQNITSIADFIGARYGKNQLVAAIVTVIALVGGIPYIALQLKAVALSLNEMLHHLAMSPPESFTPPIFGDLALIVAVALAVFSILFGTRQIDATEHQDGMMLAIAAESLIKLIAFLTVGLFVVYGLFDGFRDLYASVEAQPDVFAVFTKPLDGSAWLAMIFLSVACVVLLPRQFHVLVVENSNRTELVRARWLFPLYLIAINLFVLPIAAAGLLTFQTGSENADMFVLTLPILANAHMVTLVAFIGGLSAATAMVIVATIALSVMVCNELVVPVMLNRDGRPNPAPQDMGARLLFVRRLSIFAILLLAYAYYKLSAFGAPLAAIGLLSFAAIAQLAPAFFGGLLWRGATARGAVAGMLAGILVWTYTLLIPSLVEAGALPAGFLSGGPFGMVLLKPDALFNFQFEPVTHSVLWSMIANISAFVFVSVLKKPEPIERLQAALFVPNERLVLTQGLRRMRTSVTIGALQDAIAGYLGEQRTERAFSKHLSDRGLETKRDRQADVGLIRFAEHLLASAIGASSSRIVLSLLLRKENVSAKAAMKLLDDATTAIQQNRDLLQTALDQVGQGIAVFNNDLQLICWNRQFRVLLDLPQSLGMVGVPVSDIIRHGAARGEFGPGDPKVLTDDLLTRLMQSNEPHTVRLEKADLVLEIRSNSMPDGGLVVSFSDVTQRFNAQEGLARANETLERRVHERTQALVVANSALTEAKRDADKANQSKTRFLAAAGHDVMQPLNAARLYVNSLLERHDIDPGVHAILGNADASLEGVEEILGALLDISKLDSGAVSTERTTFPIAEVLEQTANEFKPIAAKRGLDLRVLPCSQIIRSDKRLLRRILRNLVSNAVNYTPSGKILVGCRSRGSVIAVQVLDTGQGIPFNKLGTIFKEFQRLNAVPGAQGLGLGLSIVDRLCTMLDHPISVTSREEKGTVFTIEVPRVALPLVGNHRQSPELVMAQSQTPPAPFGANHGLEGLQILCIDNEPAILDGMSTLLNGWGCKTITAKTWKEAIAHVGRTNGGIDLILADYHLDEGTGIDAIRHVRWTFGAGIPAILISADRSDQIKKEAESKGFGILPKPVKPAALRALTAQVLASREAAE